jgi:hypothetical protein
MIESNKLVGIFIPQTQPQTADAGQDGDVTNPAEGLM